MPDRTYLDWNATAPLRPEARAAMIAAMDVVGNPSSVHTEGRAAKMIVEKAREQVAALVGCASEEVVFTSGATEAATWIAMLDGPYLCADTEHECVHVWRDPNSCDDWEVGSCGNANFLRESMDEPRSVALSAANSETGVLNNPDVLHDIVGSDGVRVTSLVRDAVQAIGKTNYYVDGEFALASAHKIGGPKGVGALLMREPLEPRALVIGGGQEKGRRSGTENVIGIAGFGAAAEAAQRDLDAGAWEPIADLRDDLEAALRDCAGDDLTIFGETAPRLPNTSCFAIPGWKGETQVMQLDLAGFAVSAGSACSSGKVGPSRVLKAMGYDDNTASSAIRVSMGTTTTKDEVSRFIDAWTGLYKRMKTRAA